MAISMNDFSFKVDSVKDKWYSVASQSYAPDKKQALLKAFEKDFPDISVDSADDVLKLVGRSTKLGEWYASFNLSFIADERIPQGYRDIGNKKDMLKAQDKISQWNALVVEEQKEKLKLQDDFSKNLKKITESFDKKKKELKEIRFYIF